MAAVNRYDHDVPMDVTQCLFKKGFGAMNEENADEDFRHTQVILLQYYYNHHMHVRARKASASAGVQARK
jgi:hypothetical protein